MLSEGARTFSPAMIWTKDQGQIIHTHITYYSLAEKRLYLWKPKEFEPRDFMDHLAEIKDPGCFFSVSLSRANIFFKARYLGAEKSALQFNIPEKIFKVQRRKEIRFTIRQDYVLKFDFEDPLFPETRIGKKVLDVSAGGLSFLIPKDEKVVFQSGLVLRNLTFQINRRTITVDAEIRHCSVYRVRAEKEMIKVGLQFKNIRPGDAQHIATYVFEESRKLYSRFM